MKRIHISDAQPYVQGKRVLLPGRLGTLGTFSCHWAAVAALVRLRQPEFKSLDGDKREDLEKEPDMKALWLKLTGRSVG